MPPLWLLLLLGAWGFINTLILTLLAVALLVRSFKSDECKVVHLDDYRKDAA